MKKWSIESLSQAGIGSVLVLSGALLGVALRQASVSAMAGYVLAALLALFAAAILLKIRALDARHERAHRRLQLSETRYRQIVETAHEGIWLADAEGRITFANQRSADMVGCPVAQLQGRVMHDFIDAPPERIRCAIFEQPDEDIRLLTDLRYRRADGSVGWAIVGSHTLRNDDGSFAGALVMVTDITSRKHSEQALQQAHAGLEQRVLEHTADLQAAIAQLREEVAVRKAAEEARARSEDQLHEIITMMPVALCIKDAESRIVLMNEACEGMFGVPFAKLSGNRGSAYFPPEQQEGYLAHDREAFAGRRQIVIEESLWNAQLQETRQLQTFKKPLFDADGNPQLLIVMCVDITERKRAEQALQRSLAQLRALSDHQETIREDERRSIALDIHDELGQNLLAIKLDVSMLHGRTAPRHPLLHRQAGQTLATLDASIKSVRTIINELHPSTLELGLCAAVEWLLNGAGQRSGMRCALQIIDDSANALLDRRQTSGIFRLVQAALNNIISFGHASEVLVTLNLRREHLTIVISDDGAGILEGEQATLAAFGIRGIKERVASMGGELVLARRQGGGSALSLLLPGVDGAPPRIPPPCPSAATWLSPSPG